KLFRGVIPSIFFDWKTPVDSMCVTRSKLLFVPDCISKLTPLTRLELEHNQLRDLPDAIQTLTNLLSLNLSRNLFTETPAVLTKLTKLLSLSLSFNRLHVVHSNLSVLTALKAFKLEGNPDLTSLPIQLTSLTHLGLGDTFTARENRPFLDLMSASSKGEIGR